MKKGNLSVKVGDVRVSENYGNLKEGSTLLCGAALTHRLFVCYHACENVKIVNIRIGQWSLKV